MKFVIALIIVIALVVLYLQRRGATTSHDDSLHNAESAALTASRQPPVSGPGN